MINGFSFGYGVVVYFIMQSVLEKIAKKHLVFPSKRGSLQSAILFMLSTIAAIITQTKLYEISAMSIQSVVKLNFSRLSVCLRNAPPQWRQMTSHNVTFIDVISALYHIASNQNRNAVFMWSVDICFILNMCFYYKHNIYPFTMQIRCVIT